MNEQNIFKAVSIDEDGSTDENLPEVTAKQNPYTNFLNHRKLTFESPSSEGGHPPTSRRPAPTLSVLKSAIKRVSWDEESPTNGQVLMPARSIMANNNNTRFQGSHTQLFADDSRMTFNDTVVNSSEHQTPCRPTRQQDEEEMTMETIMDQVKIVAAATAASYMAMQRGNPTPSSSRTALFSSPAINHNTSNVATAKATGGGVENGGTVLTPCIKESCPGLQEYTQSMGTTLKAAAADALLTPKPTTTGPCKANQDNNNTQDENETIVGDITRRVQLLEQKVLQPAMQPKSTTTAVKDQKEFQKQVQGELQSLKQAVEDLHRWHPTIHVSWKVPLAQLEYLMVHSVLVEPDAISDNKSAGAGGASIQSKEFTVVGGAKLYLNLNITKTITKSNECDYFVGLYLGCNGCGTANHDDSSSVVDPH